MQRPNPGSGAGRLWLVTSGALSAVGSSLNLTRAASEDQLDELNTSVARIIGGPGQKCTRAPIQARNGAPAARNVVWRTGNSPLIGRQRPRDERAGLGEAGRSQLRAGGVLCDRTGC